MIKLLKKTASKEAVFLILCLEWGNR